MYQGIYQNGSVVEILTAQGSSTLKHAKATGPVSKIYDKQVKGYIFTLDSNGNCKLQIPRDEKHSLAIIFLPRGKSFTFEVNLTDSSRTRRRMIFTTGTKELVTNALHSRVPLGYVLRNTWVNLSIDLASFCAACFKGSVYRTFDYLTVCSHCRIRRIFTMKSPILDVNDDQHDPILSPQVEVLPRSVEFPAGVSFSNQVYTADKAGVDNSEDALAISPAHMFVEGTRVPKTVQIAFGTRVGKGGQKPEEKKQVGQSSIDDSTHNKSTIQDSVQEPFKSQHTVMGTVNLKADSKRRPPGFPPKRGTRNKQAESRISDPKLIYNTLEFKGPEESKVGIQERDASEPPRQTPLCLDRQKRHSKESPLHNHQHSLMNTNIAKDGKLRPPKNFDLRNHRVPSHSPNRGKPVVATKNGGWVQGEEKICEITHSKGLRSSGSTAAVTEEGKAMISNSKGDTSVRKGKERLNGKKPIWSAKRRDPKVPPKKINGKKLFSDKSVKQEVKPPVKTKGSEILLGETLGGVQLNSFTLPVPEINKENEKEIEEIIEADERASERFSHKDSMRDSLASPSPLLVSVAGQTQYDRNQEISSKITKTSHWLPKEEPEESKVGNEEDPIEMVGGKNPSILDCMYRPFTILNNSDNLRPFSPPFAQIKDGNTKPEASPKKRYEDSLDERIIEYRNEDDEKINVIYDPILKCYYDPKTSEYYQLDK